MLNSENKNSGLVAPGLLWAKSVGSSAEEAPYAVAGDAAGNTYTTGYYSGTVDFDPGQEPAI